MKTLFEFLKNPFYRVAGYTSLVWGVVGIVVSTAIAFLGDIHFHGLLHYGGAPNGAWWCFVVEHLVVWLVPSVLIYLSALFGSRSHVRPVDVLGTVAFAQLPFVLLSLFMALPPMREVATIQSVQAVDALLTDTPRLLVLVWIGVVSLLLSIWVLYWLFRAISVSCNLKGRNLWIVFIIGAFGGDILCRYLIGLCY
ncbi:YIP1 family protein [Barnesiella viscericola]|uniref:YIP1 family protein n=1 Tax=Barnesiella viscericola TaxID=397865 RepID=UPI00255B6BAE|nr:YIP1 family protein [Barnesiella viscericola]